MVIVSKILPHCWICGAKFIDSGGTALREDHHIVPRAYGGEDGPVVSICDPHHQRVHSVARKLLYNKPYKHLLENKGYDQKVLWLASIIVKAQKAVVNDPNKKALVDVPLTGVQQVKLDALCKKLGMSRSKALVYLLEEGYTRHFPLN